MPEICTEHQLANLFHTWAEQPRAASRSRRHGLTNSSCEPGVLDLPNFRNLLTQLTAHALQGDSFRSRFIRQPVGALQAMLQMIASSQGVKKLRAATANCNRLFKLAPGRQSHIDEAKFDQWKSSKQNGRLVKVRTETEGAGEAIMSRVYSKKLHEYRRDTTPAALQPRNNALAEVSNRPSGCSGWATPRRAALSSCHSGKPQAMMDGSARSKVVQLLQAGALPRLSSDTVAQLKQIFSYYCSYGDRNNKEKLSSAKWLKFLRERQTILGQVHALDMSAPLTLVDADVIFVECAKHSGRGEASEGGSKHKLNFEGFLACLCEVARHKYPTAQLETQGMQALVGVDILQVSGSSGCCCVYLILIRRGNWMVARKSYPSIT